MHICILQTSFLNGRCSHLFSLSTKKVLTPDTNGTRDGHQLCPSMHCQDVLPLTFPDTCSVGAVGPSLMPSCCRFRFPQESPLSASLSSGSQSSWSPLGLMVQAHPHTCPAHTTTHCELPSLALNHHLRAAIIVLQRSTYPSQGYMSVIWLHDCPCLNKKMQPIKLTLAARALPREGRQVESLLKDAESCRR